MTGTRSSYTMWTADTRFQYAADPRCIGVAFIPDGPINAVIVDCHGGGWIAQTKSNTWRHDPESILLEKSGMDRYMDAGVAVIWIEYPYGWQTQASSRWFPSSRFPQVPRAIGRCIQYLKTNRATGRVTGSVARVLPDDDAAYSLKGNSAGSIMAALVGLQPEGWLKFDPQGRSTTKNPWAVTRSHRVGCVFAYDCATDLTRYEGSAAAVPYFAAAGSLPQSSVPSSVLPGVGIYSKLAQVPTDTKFAASPISLAKARLRSNLDVSLLLANAISPAESSFQNSGILFAVDPGAVTGTLPTPGMAIAAAAGATGTVRLVQLDANGQLIFHIDAGSGPADIVANWDDVTTWSGGSLDLTDVTVFGNDTYRTFRTATQMLADWDASSGPFATSSQHHVNYLPAFKREREQHFAAAIAAGLPVVKRDRYYCGNQYSFNISSASNFDGPAFSFTTALDNIEIEFDMMRELGVPV